MALFEGSTKSLLQGVSQQIPRERQDGQVGAQLNMLSDPVTNLRRRPGAQFQQHTVITGANIDRLVGFETDLSGLTRHILIDSVAGVLRVYNQSFALEQTLAANTYLQATTDRAIRWATLGDTLFIANTEKKPALVASTAVDPTDRGFLYINAGQLNKTYHAHVLFNPGALFGVAFLEASYTTPDGTTAGDAAKATPEWVAARLVDALIAARTAAGVTGLFFDRVGQYIYINRSNTYPNGVAVPNGDLYITSETGEPYVVVSTRSYVSNAAMLPQQLHQNANGYIVATGSLQEPTYFKYNSDNQVWLESGDWQSPSGLSNMPIKLRRNDAGTAWIYDTTPYEGRLAGDDVTNPSMNFVTRGITGMSSYQGRLVLLAGSRVCMSAANKPLRWYRSTVTELLDSDPIEVGAQGNSSAAYEYAEQFQKDLVLFSAKYQALVPATNTSITPRNAQVVITSSYSADMSSRPVLLGRTLMYPTARSADFFGMLEMLPSPYTDAQYVSTDVTVHLPKYMPGRCRFAVSSTVANIALFGSSGDTRSLIVHEYLWDGDEKAQQSWHTWTFPFPLAGAYFSGGVIILILVNGTSVVHASLDARIGSLTSSMNVRPYLDLYYYDTVVDNNVTLDSWLTTFHPQARDVVLLSNAEDTLAGELVGVQDRTTNTLVTVPSFPAGDVGVGYKYRSGFVPTSPMVKDSNGVKISSNKLSILRYMIGTRNSAEFQVNVRDNATLGPDEPQQVPTLYWSSSELNLGMPRVNTESTSIVPCRTAADTTIMEVFTEGVQELNVVSLEFACRYNQKHTRR